MELKALYAENENMNVWAEAGARDALIKLGIGSGGRNDLKAAGDLVIWTIPPGGQALNRALENAAPAAVHLFAADPGMDQVKPLTERLLGLAKYALRKTKGRVSIASLAAATAQREETAAAGLQWLAARGYLVVVYEDEGHVCLGEGDGEKGADFVNLDARLRDQLGETAAFRRYYASADAELLIKGDTES